MMMPVDLLAADVRRMAAAMPAGWRAVVLITMVVLIFFPLVITVLILDALTEGMPAVRTPVKQALGRLGRWLHRDPVRAPGLGREAGAHTLPHDLPPLHHAVPQPP